MVATVDDSYTHAILDTPLVVGSLLATVGPVTTDLQYAITVSGPHDVDPIAPTGFLSNDSYITSPASATYYVLTSTLPEGSIVWLSGGSFTLAPGTTPGSYSFTYQVYNYDGSGSVGDIITADVTVT